MKYTAIQDYDRVRKFCEEHNQPAYEPSGKSWQRIEDATAAMMKQLALLNLDFKINLNRGADYYLSLV